MSRTDRVFWRAAEQILATARLAGVDLRPLTRGLGFDAATLAARRWIDWDDYCLMLERLEELCGGPDELAQLAARHVAFSEVKALAGAFLSPHQLFAFIFRVVDPLCFPCVQFDYRELGANRLRIDVEVEPQLRGCLPFMRGSVGALRAVPTHLGLPLADVEAELGTHRSRYVVRVPASQTLLARARRRTRAALDSMTALLGELTSESLPAVATAPPGAGRAAPPGEALGRIRTLYGLSPRQFEVLRELVSGCGNTEIAQRLGCAESTVELHVTALLRKLGVQSRTQLIAKCLGDVGAEPPRRLRS